LTGWLLRLVARAPANVHSKLLAAFLALGLLLFLLGAEGLWALGQANQRDSELLRLQRNIAVYRQLQNDATVQLYNATAALLDPEESALEAALRQLNQFAYDVDRLQVAARDEVELLGRVRIDYQRFVDIVNQVVVRIKLGQVDEGRRQLAAARPLSERIERQMNELVNRADAEMLQGIDESRAVYSASRWAVVGLSIGSVALALLLGYAISSSIVEPVKQIDARLSEIAAGDFSRHVAVENRDELGTLANNLNRMNDELNHLYQQIDAANRHKSEFLANMSHELRTPLNAIIGFSDVLKERMFGELNDKQAEYIEDIHSSGRHLLALINDILDLSKIEAGRMELHQSRFELRSALDTALILVRERALRRRIDLRLDLQADAGYVTADPQKIKQVLVNLLSNAVKFTPEGGTVTISARSAPAAVEIVVRDTGVGIAESDQALIFEKFRQVHGIDGLAREGTGLGLALARQYVQMHGGTIRVESAPGAGSTFTVTLPVPS